MTRPTIHVLARVHLREQVGISHNTNDIMSGSPSMDLTTDKMARRKCHHPNAITAPRAHVLLNKCTLTWSPHRAARKHVLSKFTPAGNITSSVNKVSSSPYRQVLL